MTAARHSPSTTKVPGEEGLAAPRMSGVAFPREDRRIDEQTVLGDHRRVGRHAVAALEDEGVADDDFGGFDHLTSAVAHHGNPRRQ